MLFNKILIYFITHHPSAVLACLSSTLSAERNIIGQVLIMPPHRHARGLAILQQINPNSADALFNELAAICPDLSRFVTEFAYGDIYARPGLTLAQRELITLSALAALGNATPQLKSHIVGALNAGCTRQEIVELMLQISVYAGFPAAINGMLAAKEVFALLDQAP